MSGPNGDPDVSMEDGIINDEDEFSEEGNATKPMKESMSCDTDSSSLLHEVRLRVKTKVIKIYITKLCR